MAKKTVGYVELEWTCKRCGTKNPGTVKTCANCGSPMAEGDAFELPAEQKLIDEPAKLAGAGQGPDLHCPYCGARNPTGAEACTQCGGDLKGAAARQKGAVLGAYQVEPAPAPEVGCPSCGTPNPASAPRCTNCGASLQPAPEAIPEAGPTFSKTGRGINVNARVLVVVGAVLLLCAAVAVILVLGSRTTATSATVQSVHWERSIQILEQRPVEHEAWEDQIPSGDQAGACTEKIRRTQSEPAPGAEEVCGTPYTVDQGDGLGEVVQDCEYNIYDQWCSYSTLEWQVADTKTIQGSDLSPYWPDLSLQAGQREGEESEDYAVTFITDDEGKIYTYSPDDLNEFGQFLNGSRWSLEINGFGGITEVEPK